jgi:hypothetical protein
LAPPILIFVVRVTAFEEGKPLILESGSVKQVSLNLISLPPAQNQNIKINLQETVFRRQERLHALLDCMVSYSASTLQKDYILISDQKENLSRFYVCSPIHE